MKEFFGIPPSAEFFIRKESTEQGEANTNTVLYTVGEVTKLCSGNNTVEYAYDGKRRIEQVKLNGVDEYVTYTYSGEHTDAETVTATLAKGSDCEIVATTVKNAHGNVTESTVGSKTVTNTYDAKQRLSKTVDSVSGETALAYDDKGNVTSVTAPDHSEAFVYDDKDVLTSKTVDGTTYEFAYKATPDKALDSLSVDGKTVRPSTDALGRNTGKTIEVGDNKIAEEKISYVKFGDHATNMSATVRFATNGVFNESIQYKYDSMGNIIEVFENGRSVCRYEYDTLGRLTREDNVAFGKTTAWAYDNNGNIIARYEYAITAKPTSELHLLDCVTKLYTYADNSDQLMAYNSEEFVYDTIGNPTTYRGKAATWAYGRQLTTFDGNTFAYDARGRRTAKNGITFTYDSNGNLIKQSNGLEFFYDHTGVFAVKHNGSTYFYRKDAQANVIALLDNTGAIVVKYKYDAWGKCNTVVLEESATDIANLNPFRYRSYYYDTETNLYFLKTRYYDPEVGRFLNADSVTFLNANAVNGLNLFAYCGNDPVQHFDPLGCFIITKVSGKTRIIGPIGLLVISCAALFLGLSVEYDVPLYKQGQTNLCWAYCQIMIDSYRKQEELEPEEADKEARRIAIEKNGADDWNRGSMPQDSYGEVFAKQLCNIGVLYTYLMYCGPVYGYYRGSKGDHLVVVTGVDIKQNIVYTNNPWGVKGEQTFEEFQSGFASYNNTTNTDAYFFSIYLSRGGIP